MYYLITGYYELNELMWIFHPNSIRLTHLISISNINSGSSQDSTLQNEITQEKKRLIQESMRENAEKISARTSLLNIGRETIQSQKSMSFLDSRMPNSTQHATEFVRGQLPHKSLCIRNLIICHLLYGLQVPGIGNLLPPTAAARQRHQCR